MMETAKSPVLGEDDVREAVSCCLLSGSKQVESNYLGTRPTDLSTSMSSPD